MAQDKRRPLDILNNIGHREGLARACHTEQRLMVQAVIKTLGQLLNSLGLVAHRPKVTL
jgi:hypothetical protein